jgi:hypothetical protein
MAGHRNVNDPADHGVTVDTLCVTAAWAAALPIIDQAAEQHRGIAVNGDGGAARRDVVALWRHDLAESAGLRPTPVRQWSLTWIPKRSSPQS